MGDRFDGALAGGGRALEPTINIADAMRSLVPGETLLTIDESDAHLLLRAVPNPYTGGLMCIADASANGNADKHDVEQQQREHLLRRAIARSQMTSMLTDQPRCSVYAAALRAVLANRPGALVLDIGAGTGLLSQFAARSGAAAVHGVEMFEPLAQLAADLAKENGVADIVSFHAIRSTDLTVASDAKEKGEEDIGGDLSARLELPQRADVLVSEILDSSLLGEACLPVLRDARRRLIKPGAAVIPAKAILRARVVTSDLLRSFHDVGDEAFSLHWTPDGKTCMGGVIPVPIHLDALTEDSDYTYITEEVDVFHFDFTADADYDTEGGREVTLQLQRTKPGRADAVLAWWTIDLTGDGTLTYSTAPGATAWQDHWQPVSHGLPSRGTASSTTNASIVLVARHNDMSVSFAHAPTTPGSSCTCGVRALPGGPYRIAELGNAARMHALELRIACALREAAARAAPAKLRVIDVSDGAVCASLASRAGVPADIVSIEEEDKVSAFVFHQIAQRLKERDGACGFDHRFETLADVITTEMKQKNDEECDTDVEDIDDTENPNGLEEGGTESGNSVTASYRGFDLLVSEPFVRAFAARPVASLGNLLVQVRATASVAASSGMTIMPATARLMARLVAFAPDTLQRGREGVGEVHGVLHRAYDRLCAAEARREWTELEDRDSIPLFQYRLADGGEGAAHCVRYVEIADAMEERPDIDKETAVTVSAPPTAQAEAVVLWVEYEGLPLTRVARSEVAWLTPGEAASVAARGAVKVTTRWDGTSGEWEVSLAPGPKQEDGT